MAKTYAFDHSLNNGVLFKYFRGDFIQVFSVFFLNFETSFCAQESRESKLVDLMNFCIKQHVYRKW